MTEKLQTSSDMQIVLQWKAAFERLAESISLTLGPTAAKFGKAMLEIHAKLCAEYERAGSPYGQTDEGMLQWVKEMAEQEKRLQKWEWKDVRSR